MVNLFSLKLRIKRENEIKQFKLDDKVFDFYEEFIKLRISLKHSYSVIFSESFL